MFSGEALDFINTCLQAGVLPDPTVEPFKRL
jgi:hypothetical protein